MRARNDMACTLLVPRAMKTALLALPVALSLATNVASAAGLDAEATAAPPSATRSGALIAQSAGDVTKTLSANGREDVRLTADAGLFADHHGAGVALGGELLHRRGLLALALVGSYGASPLFFSSSYRYWGGGAGGGISLPTPSWIRVDLLGIVGAHRYEGVGSFHGWFLSDPGVGATLPTVGGRVSTAFELGGRARFAIGLKAILDRDLGAATKSHVAQPSSPFGEAMTQRTDIGGTRFAALLTLGGTIGD